MERFDLSPLGVVVVEDNLNMRRMLRMLLYGFGLRDITDAADGAEGLRAIAARQPDLVVCDWSMPEMDGLELTRAVRASDSAIRFVPIIMLSGHAERSRVTAARDVGVTEFLCKPVSARALYLRIVSVIVNRRDFVRAGDFFGPDRRRFVYPHYAGVERRADTPATAAAQGG